jgi:glycosyltransferase involved in cell wall biosynthesis
MIYIDNCSTDGSVDFIKKNYPEVIVIENQIPMGFGENNNKGVYKPMQIAFEKIADTNLVPPEIKERILKDYNPVIDFEGDRFGAVSSIIKLESDF